MTTTLLNLLPKEFTDEELLAMPRLNVGLVNEVLEAIEQNPDRWEQGDWWRQSQECGSVYCFAGWACALDGKTAEDGNLRSGHGDWFDEGKRSLGLTYYEADALFFKTIFVEVAPIVTREDYLAAHKAEQMKNVKTVVEYLFWRHQKQEEAFARKAAAIEQAEREASKVVALPRDRERV